MYFIIHPCHENFLFLSSEDNRTKERKTIQVSSRERERDKKRKLTEKEKPKASCH